VGLRLKRHRLAKGWTREELAERSGVAISTLKLLETKGSGSFQRLIRVAVALGLDGEFRNLFASGGTVDSTDSVKLVERQRALRRRRGGRRRMELEVHWAGENPMPVGRLYQDSSGTVFLNTTSPGSRVIANSRPSICLT
jgi:transcriptional regulator with XRE-family HTH domain